MQTLVVDVLSHGRDAGLVEKLWSVLIGKKDGLGAIARQNTLQLDAVYQEDPYGAIDEAFVEGGFLVHVDSHMARDARLQRV